VIRTLGCEDMGVIIPLGYALVYVSRLVS